MNAKLADIQVGDTINADRPPHCCGNEMEQFPGQIGILWECWNGESQIHTDLNGVVTEPPTMRCGA